MDYERLRVVVTIIVYVVVTPLALYAGCKLSDFIFWLWQHRPVSRKRIKDDAYHAGYCDGFKRAEKIADDVIARANAIINPPRDASGRFTRRSEGE